MLRKRIWIDLTNSPHVLIFKPLIEILDEREYEVKVTAREFAQTVPLLDLFDIDYTPIGRHQGKSLIRKAAGLFSRSRRLQKWADGQGFHLAVSHGSNDLALAAFRLGVPHVTMQDYEFNTASHRVNFRLSTRVLFPDCVDAETLRGFGATVEKLVRYPGLKEEYYLHGFRPNESVLDELGVEPGNVLVTMRTPATLATYHRFENPLFDEVLSYLASRQGVTTVVLPRTEQQRRDVVSRGLANVIVPGGAVDGHSLVYFSDLVISAGGTINREAAVLGVPAYTIFAGRVGGVDQHLMAAGKLKRLERPSELVLEKRERGPFETRDPNLLADLILSKPRAGDVP
ncbi:MAG: DUF354 domain-containing protein [Actinobacteria bacterium]|nr:MAG: DUF354 domain-containing protein [Actinomycetota bacterium]